MPDPAPLLTLLAQGPAAAGRVIFWCAVLLIAAASLALAAWWLRGRLASEDDSEPLPMGFSLSDLRQLHARGELTDEEFEHAKRRMVAGTRARLEVEPEASVTADDATQTPPASGDGGIRWEDPPADAYPGSDLPPDSGLDPDPGPNPSR